MAEVEGLGRFISALGVLGPIRCFTKRSVSSPQGSRYHKGAEALASVAGS